MGIIKKFFNEGITWEDVDKIGKKDTITTNKLNKDFQISEKVYKVKLSDLLIKMGFDILNFDYDIEINNLTQEVIIIEKIKEVKNGK